CKYSICCVRFLSSAPVSCIFFFFPHPAPSEIYTLSLHDALPISLVLLRDSRLQLRLALVEVPQLGLEAGGPLLGRQVADEEHVEDHQDEQGARGDEEPRDLAVRRVRHGLG